MCSLKSIMKSQVSRLWFLAVLFLVSGSMWAVEGCTSSEEHHTYRVIKKSDSDGKQMVVAVGDDAKLSCETNIKWKKCLWKPPRNGVRQLRCEFDRDNVRHLSCPSFPEIHYDRDATGANECAIVVRRITEHHEGNWKCEFLVDDPEEEEEVTITGKIRLMARGWRYP